MPLLILAIIAALAKIVHLTVLIHRRYNNHDAVRRTP